LAENAVIGDRQNEAGGLPCKVSHGYTAEPGTNINPDDVVIKVSFVRIPCGQVLYSGSGCMHSIV
jgi:hypothetical protein